MNAFKTIRGWLAIIALSALMTVPGFPSELQFSNNASTTLASNISSTATSVSVAASTGSKFPALSGAQYFRATIVKNGNPNLYEIVKVVPGGSGDTFTIQRNLPAPDNTTPQSWTVGDFFNVFITAADMADLVQKDDLQQEAGNYAVDTGSTNAYAVTLSPPLNQHIVGMPIRFKAANTNTASSTFNDGAGPLTIVTPDSATLVPGNIQAGGISELIYDGSHFQLVGPYKLAFSQIGSQIGNGQVPLSAVAQFAPQLFSSPVLTGQPTAPTTSAGDNSTDIATTAFVQSLLAAFAPVNSPSFTGVPQGPTAAPGSNTSQLATTGFVHQAVAASIPGGNLAANGWVQFANGLILQWGYAQAGAVGGQTVDIAIQFPAQFPNACAAVFVASNRNTANAGTAASGSNFSSNYSKTGATITVDDIPGGLAGGHWFAIGF